MTLSEREILPRKNIPQTEKILHTDIGEYVKQIFTPVQGKYIENQLDEIVNDFAEDFLIAENANTNVDIDWIISKFGSSKIPVQPTDLASYFQNTCTTH